MQAAPWEARVLETARLMLTIGTTAPPSGLAQKIAQAPSAVQMLRNAFANLRSFTPGLVPHCNAWRLQHVTRERNGHWTTGSTKRASAARPENTRQRTDSAHALSAHATPTNHTLGGHRASIAQRVERSTSTIRVATAVSSDGTMTMTSQGRRANIAHPEHTKPR